MKTDTIRECLSYLRDMDFDRETLSEATTELTALDGSAMSIEKFAWNAALEAAAADLCHRAEVAQEFGHIKAAEVWRNAASAVGSLKRGQS